MRMSLTYVLDFPVDAVSEEMADCGLNPHVADDHLPQSTPDDFFKRLYKDADEDTRRAMMKSYMESGGTTLSTNWSEVGKGKVEGTPPEGTEFRKW
jgi:suppressor of G2 allele of SKP1